MREKALDRMREFLEKDKYVSSRIVYERMRCGDSDSRYFPYSHDAEKLHRVIESEDLQMVKELKKRQEKIRDLIAVIESTGEWPKTISEIYEMMRIELK